MSYYTGLDFFATQNILPAQVRCEENLRTLADQVLNSRDRAPDSSVIGDGRSL